MGSGAGGGARRGSAGAGHGKISAALRSDNERECRRTSSWKAAPCMGTTRRNKAATVLRP
ncbi:hypothetical protein XthCFBP4691_16800 [Xanthomonas theicola]|uniref:Uncharacterized protein n=1 Tax=Xanthomonas theicola TaxID=56464 RepID=A0A2S6ZBK6_9XANT|nr:hypothetical protein XthCFBP4691_16800 [Xanthomonas theicola]